MVVGKLNMSKLVWVLLHLAFTQGELRMKKSFAISGATGELKWDVLDTKFHVEVSVKTTGFVAVGFVHSPEFNHTQAEFDGFVGGFKDGAGYGASYALLKEKMDRFPEDRFQLKGSSEDSGFTKLTLERTITTCFKESFDARDVGDLAFVKVIIDPANKDLTSTEPTPKSISFASSSMVIFPITLFSKSKDKSDLDQELTLQTANSFSLRHNNEAIQNKFALCMLDYTTEDFTHWKGYIPETTSTNNYKDGVQMMVAYQCDNLAIPTGSGAPDTRKSVTDGCKNDLGVTYVNKKCQDVLFVWSPGSDGEILPKDMGIETNPRNADNRRYVMLMTYYKKAISTDSSGMTLVFGSGSSFTKVAKMMVGHFVSSKLIVMPGQDWTVQGICHSDCSANSELTSTTEITIHAVSIHHSNASFAKLKISHGVTSNPVEYSSPLVDLPANPAFQPNRGLSQPIQVNLINTDLVTECVFHEMGTLPKAGGFGADNLHCFSLLTYSPPYPLSICQSIPTEFTLQAAFGFKLKTFNDVQEEGGSSDFKRKRRSPKLLKRNKRQSDALVYDFFDRETFTGEVPNTKDSTIKKDVEELVGKASTTQLQNANLGVLGGEQFPICVSKMGRMIQLNPVKIKSGTDKDPKPASDCTSIITTPRPDKEVLNNDPIPESGVAKTTTTTTTTTTSVTTSTTTTSLKTSTINGRTIDEKTSTTTTTTRVDRKNDEAKVVPMTENIGAVIVPKFNLGFITISAWILYLL